MRRRASAGGRLGCACVLAAGLFTTAAFGAEASVRRDATVEAIERVLPSVVNIGTETLVESRGDPSEQLFRDFFDPYHRSRPPDAQYSLGSGVIIDEAGYVLTNEHVVRRANRIWVKLSQEQGGREYQADRVSGTNRSDIALLKLRARPGEKFKAVKFAQDDDLLLGETVLALGNPFGLGGSVSRGILSSKNRRPSSDKEPLDVADWLQTDAAINPGNSGGPLINLNGELIGLNVAVYREGQGIGFAVPIKRVTGALAEAFTPEMTKGLWFGAQVKAGSSRLAILALQRGSPADKAGLRAGDVVLQVNGQTPRNFIELTRQLTAGLDQRDNALLVQRGADRRTATVRLIAEKSVFNAALIQQKIGATLQELTPEQVQQLRLTRAYGFLITAVDKAGPAAEAQLQRGFIVQGIDGQAPENIIQAARLLFAKKSGDTVELDLLLVRVGANFTLSEPATATLKVR